MVKKRGTRLLRIELEETNAVRKEY
jgi:hypothetical protein